MRASKKVKGAVLLTAGAALILGAPTVYADSDTGSTNHGGLLNGVQLLNGANLNIPINACGVGALLGEGEGDCKAAAGNDNGGTSVGRGSRGGDGADSDSRTSSRNDRGILNGLQVGNNLTANVPVNACGVGALLADGEGTCKAKAGDGNGGNAIGVHSRGHGRGHAGDGGDSDRTSTTKNRGGILNGAQVLNNSDLNVPVDLCGVGLLLADGEGNCAAKAGNDNGGSVLNGGRWYRGHDGREYRDYRSGGREWREDRGGSRQYWSNGSWHAGRAGDGGDDNRTTRSSNRGGLLNGLQLLNNSDLNIPVTVCGLAVLGDADCSVAVDAGNRNGGSVYGGRGGDVEHAYTHHRHWENEVLPHTGAAGLALLPFGLALVAGGVALRRRVSSQR